MLKEGQRLFGTDGVRGVANLELGPILALDLARAAGEVLGCRSVVIGRDTRRSGEMLRAALHAGFHAVGVDTIDAGVIPVGGVSTLIGEYDAEAGVMVSASHNAAPDNGIKFFDRKGYKLSDDLEDRIEARLRSTNPYKVSYGEKIGTRYDVGNAQGRYLKALRQKAEFSFNGIPLALDCANGAASLAAPELFRMLKADIEVHYAEPTGMNINEGCGATHPEAVASLAGGRIGLAFDGDADRLVAIDEDGVPANGDVIMAVIAAHMKEQGKLRNNLVVSTVMANLGFRRAMASADIEVIETQVGDRYVLEAMREHKAILGGEQSGHVICLDRSHTGDGLLTAIRLLEVVAATGKELRELRQVMTEFPQVLHNVEVAGKERLDSADEVWDAVRAAEVELGDDGRVLVRASGTESLVRVMVEASTESVASQVAEQLASVTERALA